MRSIVVQKMNPETVTSQTSILDQLGIYPVLLAFLAIILGILAIILRRRIANLAIAHALVAVALLGFGCTAWRIHSMNSYFMPGGGVDPTSWMISLGNSWMPSGVVLPTVGLSFMLVSISWVFTKSRE